MVTPANRKDSPEFNEIISTIDEDLLRESIPTFDFIYYDLEKFRDLENRNIMFITRIKDSAKNLL